MPFLLPLSLSFSFIVSPSQTQAFLSIFFSPSQTQALTTDEIDFGIGFGFAQGKQLWLSERMWWVDGGVAVDLIGEVSEANVVGLGLVLGWGGSGSRSKFFFFFLVAVICGCGGFG